MFQLRPLRLYYSVHDGPEVALPDETFSRSRPTNSRSPPTGRLGSLPTQPDVKPTVSVDVKPAPPSLENFSTENCQSANQTRSGRKRRRRSSDGQTATEDKRIKQEKTSDSHQYGGSAGQGDVMTTTTRTSPRRDAKSGGSTPLSLPVTISKDFIKELVVSRGLEKQRTRNSGVGEADRRNDADDRSTLSHPSASAATGGSSS